MTYLDLECEFSNVLFLLSSFFKAFEDISSGCLFFDNFFLLFIISISILFLSFLFLYNVYSQSVQPCASVGQLQEVKVADELNSDEDVLDSDELNSDETGGFARDQPQ